MSDEAKKALAAESKPTKKGGSRIVEEIIVTAQKREENLMAVPISVQAYSAAALEARGVSSTVDLMKITPALDYGTQAGDFTSVYIRGIGSEAWLTSDPSVATYVDGVYYPFSPSVAQDLGGIERVEVLKGPQGTLFGRNANGGAINVIVKEPSFDAQTLTASYGVGAGEQFFSNRMNLFANMPLTDQVAVNVSSYFMTDSTYWDRSSTIGGIPIPYNKTAASRIKLRVLPIDNLDIRLTFQGSKRDGTATAAAPITRTLLGKVSEAIDPGLPGTPGGRCVECDARHYIIHEDLPIYGNLETLTANMTAIYKAPWFDTKLLASNQANSNPYNYDYDGTELPGASFIVHRHYARIREAELQLLSNQGTPFSDILTLTGGLFYFRNTQGFDPVEVTVGGLNPAQLAAAVPQTSQLGVVQALNSVGLGGLLGNLSTGLPSYALSNVGLTRTESWSYFAQATIKPIESLAITAGIRYQNERRGVLASSTSLRLTNVANPIVFNWTQGRDACDCSDFGNPVPLSHVTAGFKPKFAVDYTFPDNTLLYGSYQKAVKAHSFNAFAFYLPPAYTPPEGMTAYELGLKTRLFDDAVRFTAALWRYDLTNLQTQAISLLNGGALSISTAGNARSQGFEFDTLVPLFSNEIQDLVLTLNGAYVDAIYTKYTNGQGHAEGTGVFLPAGQDYTGNRITRTPKYTASASLSKTWQVPSGPLEATASYYFNSGFSYEASENPLFSQPAYFTLGGHLSYLYEPYNLRATLTGENLTGKFSTGGELLLDWGAMATLAPRRTVTMRIDWTF